MVAVNVRFSRFCALCVSAIAFAASACGGGGGGGGGGGSASDSGVRVFHAAIDATPVDVLSSASSTAVVSGEVFAGTKGYRDLPGGSQVLSLIRTLTPTRVIGTFDLTATKDTAVSILLYGSNQSTGLRAKLLNDEVPDLQGGAVVRVVNGALGAGEVSVSLTGGATLTVPYSTASEYVAVPLGSVSVSASSGSGALPSAMISAEANRAYTVLLGGEVGYYVATRVFVD